MNCINMLVIWAPWVSFSTHRLGVLHVDKPVADMPQGYPCPSSTGPRWLNTLSYVVHSTCIVKLATGREESVSGKGRLVLAWLGLFRLGSTVLGQLGIGLGPIEGVPEIHRQTSERQTSETTNIGTTNVRKFKPQNDKRRNNLNLRTTNVGSDKPRKRQTSENHTVYFIFI